MTIISRETLNNCIITTDSFSKYNGKTIESVVYLNIPDDYPRDNPMITNCLTLKFTDGTQCVIGGISWTLGRD